MAAQLDVPVTKIFTPDPLLKCSSSWTGPRWGHRPETPVVVRFTFPRSGGETGKAGGTNAKGATFERRRREDRGAEGVGCVEGVSPSAMKERTVLCRHFFDF